MILELRKKLNEYWSQFNINEILSYDGIIGAATYHPKCFFGVFDKSLAIQYFQRCTREADGREGLSPNRLLTHTQYQVLIKPAPDNIKELYLGSLKYIGLDIENGDIKFVENNWESQSLGAFGVGWEVLYNGTEITQFTYFDKMGDISLDSSVVELAYGMERCALMIKNSNNVYDLTWNENLTYGDIYLEDEIQFSKYYKHFSISMDFDTVYEKCLSLLNENLYLPAYRYCLFLNNIFNEKDAKGEISGTFRSNYMTKMRQVANLCGEKYLFLKNN